MPNQKMSYKEEQALSASALEHYMDMMVRAHQEKCGRESFISHGTYWCSLESKVWTDDRSGEDRPKEIPVPTSDGWPGWSQFMFIRDTILQRLFRTQYVSNYPPNAKYENQVGATVPDVVVVGVHTSKSVNLPVMQFKWRDLLVTTRYNFHDWKVSIELPGNIDPSEDLLNIARVDDHLLNPIYFEGFPSAYIYPSLITGEYILTGRFSTMFGSQYNMYTFFWLLKRWYERCFGPLNHTDA